MYLSNLKFLVKTVIVKMFNIIECADDFHLKICETKRSDSVPKHIINITDFILF